MLMRLLLAKRMLNKMAMLLQLVETEVIVLLKFLMREYRQDQGSHRMLDV